MKKIFTLFLSLVMLFSFSGCSQKQTEKTTQNITLSLNVEDQNETNDVDVYVDSKKIDTIENNSQGTYQLELTQGTHHLKAKQEDKEATKSFQVTNTNYYAYQIDISDSITFSKSTASLENIPEYNGQPYVELDDNQPTFSKEDYQTNTYIQLSDLDHLGRTGRAIACLGQETMPSSKRESIGMIKPSGWKTQRYDDLISTKYLYNRCHQIAFMLSGLNAEEKNLMTGTRYFNVTGMLPFEEKVSNYIKNTNHHVLYEAIPIYQDDELVARGLVLQAASIEDEEIRFRVYIYNVQPGITIDYQTGDSRKATEGECTYGISEEKEPFDYHQSDTNEKEYVLNIKNKKYHDPHCSSVSRMSDSNKEVVTSTAKQLNEQGYSPCGICQK